MTGEREQVHGVLTRALSSVRQAESELRSHTTDDIDDFDAASFVNETRALFRSRSVDSSQRTGNIKHKENMLYYQPALRQPVIFLNVGHNSLF